MARPDTFGCRQNGRQGHSGRGASSAVAMKRMIASRNMPHGPPSWRPHFGGHAAGSDRVGLVDPTTRNKR